MKQKKKIFLLALSFLIIISIILLILYIVYYNVPKNVGVNITSPRIEHVVLIAFENHGYNAVNKEPYFNYLARTYGKVNYKDLKHAGFCSDTHSLPNYMAITSGTTLWNGEDKCGTDSASWTTDNSNNIFSLLQDSGMTYGSWAEGYNGNYDLKATCGSGCIVRHIPTFFYSNPKYNLANYKDWDEKYLKGNDIPPNFSFITPNGCDSAHDCGVSKADNWLKNTFNLPTLLQKQWASNSVFIIWFDESEDESNGYLVFVCPNCQGHIAETNPYNLMATIEWMLGLGSTGNNDDPYKNPPMIDLFK